MRTLVLSGSNSGQAINESFALKLSIQNKYEYLNLSMLHIPPFIENASKEDVPYDITGIQKMIKAHDVVVVVNSVYLTSISAFFLNLAEWMSIYDDQVFKDKPLIVLSVSDKDNQFINYTSNNLDGYALDSVKTIVSGLGGKISYFQFISDYTNDKDYTQTFETIDQQVNLLLP